VKVRLPFHFSFAPNLKQKGESSRFRVCLKDWRRSCTSREAERHRCFKGLHSHTSWQENSINSTLQLVPLHLLFTEHEPPTLIGALSTWVSHPTFEERRRDGWAVRWRNGTVASPGCAKRIPCSRRLNEPPQPGGLRRRKDFNSNSNSNSELILTGGSDSLDL
jgi:hypothetical protein